MTSPIVILPHLTWGKSGFRRTNKMLWERIFGRGRTFRMTL